GVVDPVALHRRTDSLLRGAGSARSAARALREFAAAFHDGHFQVRRPPPALVRRLGDWWLGRGQEPPALELDAGGICSALGYERKEDDGLLLQLPQAHRLTEDGAPFPAATLPLADGRTAGVLRIASFSTHRYRGICESVWPRVRDSLPQAEACGEECEDAVWWAVSNELLAEERRALAALERAGASLLVVDLTGNGGGTDWADPAARQLSPKPLRGQPSGFIRHRHYVPRLADAVRDLDSALALPEITDTQRTLLTGARARADSAHRLALEPCDRTAIWTLGPRAVSCRQLQAGLLHVTGWLDYLPRGEARGMPAGTAIFWPAEFDYVEGAWSGPVLLAVDERTASAAEQFVVLLRDNEAAVVVGSRTAGAGCGYTDGGLPVRLEHSGLEVRIPDCARYRRNGDNEVAGVVPDHAAGWDDAGADQARSSTLRDLLSRVPPAGTAAAPAAGYRRAGSSPAPPRS
ncbi:MAG TPA: S41 family peptidase, partial [Gemmatimonadales bacterium]